MMPSRTSRFLAWLTLASFFSSSVIGANVDIASVPLVSMSTKVVRPNVMFILDDSSSMTWDYMPDEVNNNNSRPCFRNSGYNKVYYNPNMVYERPKQANGSDYAYVPSITSARQDGYNASSTVNDLTATTTTTSYGTNVTIGASASFSTTSGTRTVRVSRNGHGLNTNDLIRITGTPTTGTLNGIPWSNITWVSGTPQIFQVTRIDADNFTFVANGTTNATSGSSLSGANGYNFARATVTTTGNYYYYTHPTNPSTCDTDSNYTRVDIISRSASERQNF